jgi:pimeloyl-ACP methyl ester carboxylesterase
MQLALRILLWASVAIFLLLAIGPFLVPVSPLEDTVPPRALADPDSRFINIDRIAIHYKIAGRGEPAFVLFHGFGASTFTWREVISPMSAMATVVSYDRPAFGLTERPLEWEGANPYASSTQVDLALGLLDALRIERAILVGHSAGGRVAAEFALAHPERTAALVLVDPAIFIDESDGSPWTWIRALMHLPQIDHLGPLFVRNIANTGNDAIRLAWHDPTKVDDDVLAGYRKPLHAENWDRALWEMSRAAEISDLRERLREISIPTMIITGDDDRIVPAANSRKLGLEIPRSQFVLISSCGHVPHEECPEDFLSALHVFLRPLAERDYRN